MELRGRIYGLRWYLLLLLSLVDVFGRCGLMGWILYVLAA